MDENSGMIGKTHGSLEYGGSYCSEKINLGSFVGANRSSSSSSKRLLL